MDVRALSEVDYSRLVTVAQLLWIRGWVGLNILDTVRDPIRNLVRANGGCDLTKD